MNAVNLIPSSRRPSGPTSLSESAPLLGVCLVLLLALAATVVFVRDHDQVGSRRTQLAHVQVATQKWQASAAGFSADVIALKQRTKAIETTRELAEARYDWSLLLGQLAGLMPKDTHLTTITASNSSAASAAAAGATQTTPGISVSACATSQTSVAAAMVAFRRIVGVSEVSLQTSTKNGSGGSSASGASCGGLLSVSFDVTLTFAPPNEGTSVKGNHVSSGSTTSSAEVVQ